jgi:hypothetical protein
MTPRTRTKTATPAQADPPPQAAPPRCPLCGQRTPSGPLGEYALFCWGTPRERHRPVLFLDLPTEGLL